MATDDLVGNYIGTRAIWGGNVKRSLNRVVCILFVVGLIVTGCGEDSGDGDGDSATTAAGVGEPAPPADTTTPGATSDPGGPAPNATFTLGGDTRDVTIVFCGFEGETGNDDVLFSMRAQTFEDGAATFTYDGTVIDLGNGEIPSLEVWEGASTASPPILEPDPFGESVWEIDGNDVRFEAGFVDADGGAAGAGVFEGSCP